MVASLSGSSLEVLVFMASSHLLHAKWKEAELFGKFDLNTVLEGFSICYAFKQWMKLILTFIIKELEADALAP